MKGSQVYNSPTILLTAYAIRLQAVRVALRSGDEGRGRNNGRFYFR